MSDDRHPSPRIPKTALLTLFRTLSGVETYWRTDPGPVAPGQSGVLERARLFVKLNSYLQIGTDELRTKYDPVADQNDCLLVGQRQFTTSLRAESQDLTLEPADLCERVRFRLRTAVARSIFVPAGLALRDCQTITTLEQKIGDRVYPVAIMDVRWNYTLHEDPLDPFEGQYFREVNGGGPITGTVT